MAEAKRNVDDIWAALKRGATPKAAASKAAPANPKAAAIKEQDFEKLWTSFNRGVSKEM